MTNTTTMPDALQIDELRLRRIAENCTIYAPGKLEPDSQYKATLSGQRSAACGDRWMNAKSKLKEAGLATLADGFTAVMGDG